MKTRTLSMEARRLSKKKRALRNYYRNCQSILSDDELLLRMNQDWQNAKAVLRAHIEFMADCAYRCGASNSEYYEFKEKQKLAEQALSLMPE